MGKPEGFGLKRIASHTVGICSLNYHFNRPLSLVTCDFSNPKLHNQICLIGINIRGSGGIPIMWDCSGQKRFTDTLFRVVN